AQRRSRMHASIDQNQHRQHHTLRIFLDQVQAVIDKRQKHEVRNEAVGVAKELHAGLRRRETVSYAGKMFTRRMCRGSNTGEGPMNEHATQESKPKIFELKFGLGALGGRRGSKQSLCCSHRIRQRGTWVTSGNSDLTVPHSARCLIE